MLRSLPPIVLVVLFAARAAFAAPLLFRDVRIFDGAKVTQGDVLVDQGLIRAVGPKLAAKKGTKIIDGSGKTLLPGLIDSHTHAYDPNALE
jgi:imidazolonepropionase-like amidohydrolase